jgi:hypothetical protein
MDMDIMLKMIIGNRMTNLPMVIVYWKEINK